MKPIDHGSLLLGEMREFKARTLERLGSIEKKVDSFHAFKSKVIGMATLASFFATATVTIIAELIRH